MSEEQENASEEQETSSGDKETLVIASKTKAYLKSQGCIVSADSVSALNKKVYELLDLAVMRTKENKRTTVRPHDF